MQYNRNVNNRINIISYNFSSVLYIFSMNSFSLVHFNHIPVNMVKQTVTLITISKEGRKKNCFTYKLT